MKSNLVSKPYTVCIAMVGHKYSRESNEFGSVKLAWFFIFCFFSFVVISCVTLGQFLISPNLSFSICHLCVRVRKELNLSRESPQKRILGCKFGLGGI